MYNDIYTTIIRIHTRFRKYMDIYGTKKSDCTFQWDYLKPGTNHIQPLKILKFQLRTIQAIL